MSESIVPSGLDATIAFVRHGESEWVAEGRFQGRGDPPLSATGSRQALLTARRLARRMRPPALPLPVDPPLAIVHSPLLRAAGTAGLVAQALGGALGNAVQGRADAGLMEIGQGEWEGLPGSVVAERWGPLLETWRVSPLTAWAPGGEALPEVDARVRLALASILAELAAATPVRTAVRSQVLGYAERPSDEPWSIVVGHDGVFKVAVLALLDLPLERFWTLPFALCGITIVELRAGRPRLRLHNATDHLASLENVTKRAREQEQRRAGAL
jgi:broad specificity phosphatase PhoE